MKTNNLKKTFSFLAALAVAGSVMTSSISACQNHLFMQEHPGRTDNHRKGEEREETEIFKQEDCHCFKEVYQEKEKGDSPQKRKEDQKMENSKGA